MNSKHMMTMACAVAFSGGVQAELNWKMGEGVTFDETPIVSTEVGLAFDSKFLSYGLVDNNDPILTPSASITWFDMLSFGVSSIFDMSRYGKAAGYGNRAWRYQELDPSVDVGHDFSPDEIGWLPTTVSLTLGYMYEYHPKTVDDDTQFVNFTISLPDIWIEPEFSYERDTCRDNGTYLSLNIGHSFAIISGDNEEDDPTLCLRPSVGQGWGDGERIDAYLDVERSGMMDFILKCEMIWRVTDWMTLTGYVAYTDYLMDESLRTRARQYEATGHWTESWNFTTGLALAMSF